MAPPAPFNSLGRASAPGDATTARVASIALVVARSVAPLKVAFTVRGIADCNGSGAAWHRDVVDRWRRPAHARRSTHNRAECLGARLGVTDGTDRSRPREQFLHFGCR